MRTLNLSVLLPTLNCVHMLPAHLESMASWMDLADEIIVVDSDSEDGTPEMIRERLKHPGLRILSHPRGLYQSWNHGIRQTTGRWIYISTIGDLIERHQLAHLMACGDGHGADVVCSPPAFLMTDPAPLYFKPWPITQIIRDAKLTEPRVIPSLEIFVHALLQIPNAVLGSSASNLYRGEHLREHPFPVDYGVCGDTAWAHLHAFETRFCYSPRTGSIFVFHEKPHQALSAERVMKICSDIRLASFETIMRNQSDFPPEFSKCVQMYLNLRNEASDMHRQAEEKMRAYRECLPHWMGIKRDMPPWYLTGRGWRARKDRKHLREEWQEAARRAKDAEKAAEACEHRLNELLEVLRADVSRITDA